MKNWKTTLGGFCAGLGTLLTNSADPRIHIVGVGLVAVGVSWFGYHAVG